MNGKTLFTFFVALTVGFSACQPHMEPCTVKGTVRGVSEGAELVLQDAWNKYKVISTATVKDGTFEFHPSIPAPTHVYLYATNPKDVYANLYDGGQLKDFILEPGTVFVDVDAGDESDMATGATGTVLNDAYRKILFAEGEEEKAALWEEAMSDGRTNLLALLYAAGNARNPTRALELLDRLSPEQARAHKAFISRLKKKCARNIRAEERKKDVEQSPKDTIILQHYIDMEFPDTDGRPVSLSSVVDNPANRYVVLDFWATWCLPCVKSIPTLKEVYDKYHGKGLEIYSVSQDTKAGEWKAFVAENGMPWINVLSGRDRVYRDYGIELIPTVFLIDCKTGEILLRDGQPDLEAILSDLLQ